MPPSAESAATTSSYRQIFKSTALVGGVQVVNICIGVLRTKALAVLLGPSGVGILAMYQSATGVIGTLTGMGITQSGVRQVAAAAASRDDGRWGRTVRTLRAVALLTGLLGMALVLAFSRSISQMTFGTEDHAAAFAALSVTLLLSAVAGGQNALLQGLRRLKELAWNQIAGTAIGSAIGVILIYAYREQGIVPLLVVGALVSVVSSWWFARRVSMAVPSMGVGALWAEARGLLSMGAAFMLSGVLSAGAVYLCRVLITRELGIQAVGLYTAAWTLSSLYVTTVLGAMGADYYPRLTAAADDDLQLNRLANEQTELGVLIATPGILFTLALAPLVLTAFYSSEFAPAADVIRWQILGVGLRVVSWPLGFMMLAKGRAGTFAFTEALFWSLLVVLVWLGVASLGLEGSGVAFALTYAAVLAGYRATAGLLSGFRWSRRALTLSLICGGFWLSAALALRWTGPATGTSIALAMLVAASIFCLRHLQRILEIDLASVIARVRAVFQ